MVEVKELNTPPEIQRVRRQARHVYLIRERAVAVVLIEVRNIFAEIRFDDIERSIFIVCSRPS